MKGRGVVATLLHAGWAASALLILAGCGPRPAETEAVRIPPGLESRFYPPEGWAWGRLTVKDAPPLRYGVASPPVAPRAQILILPGAGEPAEAWFETVNALVARKYGVWVLDWTAQGGSQRYAGTGQRAHLASATVNPAALDVMVRQVIRPHAGQPLILIADGMGSTLALNALAGGLPASGAVLDAPALAPAAEASLATTAHLADRAGLGRIPAFGVPGPVLVTGHDPMRARQPAAWARGNANLKLQGVTLGWIEAFGVTVSGAKDQAALKRAKPPVLMTVGGGNNVAAATVCKALPDCRLVAYPGGRGALHLETDAVRDPWLEAVAAFVEAQGAGESIAAPPMVKP